MKRIITATLILLAVPSAICSAQVQTLDGRGVNEISLSYGRASLPGFINTFAGLFGTVFTFGTAKPSKIFTSGAFGFEYLRTVHPRVSVGFLATYEYGCLEFTTGGKDGKPGKTSPDYNHYISIMPTAKFPWFAYEHVSMYSKVGVGCMLLQTGGHTEVNSDGTETVTPPRSQFSLAMQVSAVGVDFGGMRCRGFAEAGFGTQGLILAGVRFNL